MRYVSRCRPSVSVDEPGEDLGRLGEALKARNRGCAQGDGRANLGVGEVVDAVVQESFERICNSSTIAVARWIRGGGY